MSEQFYDNSKNRIWALDRLCLLNAHVGDEAVHTTDHGILVAYFEHHPA